MSLQDSILQTLDKNGSIEDTSALHNDQNEVSGVLRSLESRNMITFKQLDKEKWNLTKEAQNIVDNGSPEATLYQAVVESMNGLKISDVQVFHTNANEQRKADIDLC